MISESVGQEYMYLRHVNQGIYLLGARLQHARIQNVYQKDPTQVFF